MNAIESHRVSLKWAAELLAMVTAEVTEEQAAWQPPGTANPLGAQYAHAVCGTDAIINMLLRGQAPLYDSTWAGRTGVSQPQMQATEEWARSVEVSVPALQEYARAVFADADAYIASLSEDDLVVKHDLSASGLGTQTVDWMLSALVTGHVNNMAGEISCLKGLQGAKGYPF